MPSAAEYAVAVANLRLTAELLRVMQAFDARGIPALPFKGPVLAALLYGDRVGRDFSDLDILVRPADVARAIGLLAGLGYEPAGDQEHWFWECGRQRPLLCKSRGTAVDLHWGLMPKSFAGDLGGDGVWERSQRVRVDGRDIPTLGDEDLLLFLCVHGTKHQWASPGLVRDVAELLRVRPAIDLDWVMKEARRTGTRRMLEMGLQLVGTGGSVPSEARGQSCLSLFFYQWRVSERWRDRWRLVRGTVFEAMPADRQAYKLPRPLWPLYPVIRPFRLVAKYVRR